MQITISTAEHPGHCRRFAVSMMMPNSITSGLMQTACHRSAGNDYEQQRSLSARIFCGLTILALPLVLFNVMETIPLLKGCVWGPFQSPRLGRTLWINPLPTAYKLCSLNCLYCRLGASDNVATDVTPYENDMPSAERILSSLEDTLLKGADFDTLAVSGNGEPTLHPEFGDIARGIRGLLADNDIKKTFALLSNSTTLVKEDIKNLVSEFDLPIFKLDAGREETFERVNRPDPHIKFEDIVTELKELGPGIHLQAVFVAGPSGNMNARDLEAWMKIIREIKPKAVEIYSTNREFPGMGIQMVPLVILEELAKKAEKYSKIPVVAYGNWR
ncbi:radical SAM protein [candidate division WOR-3 bacterium]|uniref:Radical SAM protein n=1 Tax=candidate division WOR-3 bacterium TaxID=2052148 RepID=A0A9D5K979_UNCW3|nr:radical SAM protein [candidate division WOR-3 bacterium]MBD3364658.1 radical SAM protein [candidate division WOR-3 bacterium]